MILKDICSQLNLTENETNINGFDLFDCQNSEYWNRLRFCIKASISQDNFLWFTEEGLTTYYQGVLGSSFVKLTNSQGQKIEGCNTVVTPGFGLTDSDVRDFFTLLEFLVFKLVHISIENNRNDYFFATADDLGCWDRIKQLRTLGYISNKEKDILSRLLEVRNKFAHTINSLSHIPYRGYSLNDSFSKKGRNMIDLGVTYYFDEDAYRISQKLLDLYQPIQDKQLDKTFFLEAIKNIYEANTQSP